MLIVLSNNVDSMPRNNNICRANFILHIVVINVVIVNISAYFRSVVLRQLQRPDVLRSHRCSLHSVDGWHIDNWQHLRLLQLRNMRRSVHD